MFDEIRARSNARAEHFETEAVVPPKLERFEFDEDAVRRTVTLASGQSIRSALPNLADKGEADPHRAFDQSYLRTSVKPACSGERGSVRIVDLFCGAGGASLGIEEACRALGFSASHVFAADIDSDAMATYVRNFAPASYSTDPIELTLSRPLGAKLSKAETNFRSRLGRIDIAFGGPPCQGHSNLNNHTRRADPKNSLYDRMARFAEVVEPTTLIIENVPGVRHDVNGVYDRTLKRLRKIGYSVAAAKVEAEAFGVPQRRHRELVVATRNSEIGEGFFVELRDLLGCSQRSVAWAISDLLTVDSSRPIDRVTRASKESQRRIDWMFDNNQYDLPDAMRPDCHRLNDHSYKAVYGRLYWDRPAWTITTGFQVMGQGRFLHPKLRRVITSHEAARLQFVPDFFEFSTNSRKGFAKMIGNAVPSKLSYALAVQLMR